MLARTDHLFAGKLQLKLQTSVRPMTNNVKRDINCLKDFFIAQQFYITVRNKCKFSKRYEGPGRSNRREFGKTEDGVGKKEVNKYRVVERRNETLRLMDS